MSTDHVPLESAESPAVGRRSVLLGLGAAAGAGALGGIARAASGGDPSRVKPEDAPQGAGFYRFAIGDVECYSIGDGDARLPAYPFWGKNASEEAVENALRAATLSGSPTLMHFNVLMLRRGSETWLVDAGNGANDSGPGRLAETLARLGVARTAIDGIVLSHLHGDHYKGLFDADGELVFPNARYVIHRDERDFWKDSPDLSGTSLPDASKRGTIEGAQRAIAAVEATKRLDVVDETTEITGGISVLRTGGHTPGHLTVVVERDGERFEMIVDAVHHHVLSFRHPEWHLQFDYDARDGARTRRRVLDRLSAENMLVMGYHTPWPGVGRVARDGDAFEWKPEPWKW